MAQGLASFLKVSVACEGTMVLFSMRSTDGKTQIIINSTKAAMRGLAANILLATDGEPLGDIETQLKGYIEK